MASRTEKIGTIFSRVTSLMRGKVLTSENLPIWYDVYKAFPPKYEPRFDRVTSNKKIRDIFYVEDDIRARFHKDVKLSAIDLKSNNVTQTHLFLALHENALSNNDNDKEKAYEMAMEEYKKHFIKNKNQLRVHKHNPILERN